MSDALLGAVRTAWREAAAGAPGARAWRAVRTSCPGPLAVLAAIREADGALSVLFESAIECAPAARGRFEADGISMLEERNYPERTYRIAVALERSDLENIFGIVIADLIEAAGNQPAPAVAIASLFSRLSAWQAFLRARHTGLGRELIIGLIGELAHVSQGFRCGGMDGRRSMRGKGPAGGLHDFVRRGRAIEVKTGAGVASAVEISSLDQLEDAGLTTLLLAHVHLAEAPAGLSLPGLVSAIADELQQQAPEALHGFRDALLASGYADVDADLYLGPTYQQIGTRYYVVSPGFPRLTRSSVSQGVTEAHYRLDLRAIQPHIIDDGAATEIMRQMGDFMTTEAPLDTFARELAGDVDEALQADASEPYSENHFTRLLLDELAERTVFENPVFLNEGGEGRFGRAQYKITGFEFSDDEERLLLVTTIHTGECPPKSVPRDMVMTAVERAIRFFDASCKGLHTKIEPANTDASDLARRIFECHAEIKALRVVVLSDGLLGTLSRELADRYGDTRVVAELYGIEQLYRVLGKGETRADIVIDVVQALGTALPCLPVGSKETGSRRISRPSLRRCSLTPMSGSARGCWTSMSVLSRC